MLNIAGCQWICGGYRKKGAEYNSAKNRLETRSVCHLNIARLSSTQLSILVEVRLMLKLGMSIGRMEIGGLEEVHQQQLTIGDRRLVIGDWTIAG